LILLLLIFFAPDLSAQNTKGDQPAAKQTRHTKFKKKKDRKSKGIFGKRIRTSQRSSASRANSNYPVPHTARKTPKSGGDRVGKPLSPIIKNRPDIGNRRVNVYPQKGRFVNKRSITAKEYKQRQRVNARKKPAPSFTGKFRKIYPQRRIGERSASRAYISHRSINPFAGFWNKRRKGEKPWTGDISGRRLRTKNFQTQKLPLQPQPNPYYGRKRVGDKPYKGPTGGYKSATRTGRAWKGDISGRKIRGRNFSSKKGEVTGTGGFVRRRKTGFGDRPYKGIIPGVGNRSASGKIKSGKTPIQGKTPAGA
jgi:hypothetical protein